MNKCSYYRNSLLKKNNNYSNTVNLNVANINKKYNYKNKFEECKNDQDETIIKCGLLKKQSLYYYDDLRKVALYDTPRIDYILPEKKIVKGRIFLTKECAAQLVKKINLNYIPLKEHIILCVKKDIIYHLGCLL